MFGKIIIIVIVLLAIGLTAYFIIQNNSKQTSISNKIQLEQVSTTNKTYFKEKEINKQEDKMNNNKISITTLFDNYQFNSDLQTGWGFSCLIETNSKKIIFDTGADGLVLMSNMEKLSINPKDINLIVLSHIHGDHVNGLDEFLAQNSDVIVYIPQSFPDSFKQKIESAGAKYQNVKDDQKIIENIYTTGEMDSASSPQVGTAIKEQSIIIDTDKGLVIITGCAHPGIVDIIKKAKQILDKNIYLVMGGFHLSSASDNKLE